MDNTVDSQQARLGSAPLGRLILNLAIPTILAQLVNVLYNMVDRMYVGRIEGAGPMALAGLGVTFPIIIIVSAFASLVGSGGAPKAAIALGKQDKEEAEKILGSSTAMLVIQSVMLAAIFYMVKDYILMLFGASEVTLPYANQYLGIYLLGTISVQLALGLNQFITCQGFSKTSMCTVLIGAVLNIVLDPIFIFVLDMGVAGAALATVISQSVSAIWVVWFLISKKSMIRIRKEYLKLDWNVLVPVLLLGLSPFIMSVLECLVQLTFNSGMQKYGNDYYVSAITIIFSVMQFISLPVMGLVQGTVPIISYNFGAGNTQRVKDAFRIMTIMTVTLAFCSTATVLLFPGTFVQIFTDDAETLRIASYGMRIFLFGYLPFGFQMACQMTFLALGQAKISMMLSLLRKAILLIPLALILPTINDMGTLGLFLAESIADLGAVIATTITFALNFKKILKKGV